MKENSFTLKKARKENILQRLMDTDYADNLELLTDTPAQAESVLNSLEQTKRSIGL